jgi:hypothetical protein
MSCEHEKRKKLPIQYSVSKNREKPFFLRFFGLLSSGLVEQKLFAIMKGDFSALAVKKIREKSKNDPP